MGAMSKILTISLLFVFFSVHEKIPAQELTTDFRKPGFSTMEFRLKSGEKLPYSVYQPVTGPNDSVPLIVALHWGGEVTPWFSMNYLRTFIEPAFKELEAYIIAPDCPANGWEVPLSEEFVLELVENAKKVWPVDPRKIVLTGYSMGAKGTWFLGARHPELFCAAIPVSGVPRLVKQISLPVYAINSKSDELMDYKLTQVAIRELKKEGFRTRFVLLDGPGHYNTNAFVKPVSFSIPWLKGIFKEIDKERKGKK